MTEVALFLGMILLRAESRSKRDFLSGNVNSEKSKPVKIEINGAARRVMLFQRGARRRWAKTVS